MPAIECQYCLSENFETQNGATFCLTCGAESQEHGQETIVDEETIGAFSDGQSSGLSSKSLKKKKKKKRRYQDKQKVPFTTIQVYSYMLRGWVHDAINELEMTPYAKELNTIVLALWAKYLSKCRLGFVPKKKSRKIVKSFRDMQMAITNRRRILTHARIAGYRHKQANLTNESSTRALAESEYSGESQEAKKKRRKAKRSFLASVSVSHSEDEDSSSYYTDLTDEDSDEADKSDEDHEEIEQVHLRILSQLQVIKKTRRCSAVGGTEPYLNSQIVFILFTLGMLLVKNSRFTLNEILQYAKTGIIAFNTSAQHVPPALKLDTGGDIKKFSMNKADDFQHLQFSRLLNDMSGFLKLRKMEFVDVIDVLERCLKELSLPSRLLSMIKKQWNVPGLIKLGKVNPSIWRSRDKVRTKREPAPLPSPTIRALALTLMALKYLFGLDDVSEYCLRNESSFNILQWLKLSRQRAFWACKYSYVFHKLFNKELFDGDVHMSSDTWYEHTRARRVQQSKSRNHQSTSRRVFYAGTKELSQNLAEDLYIKEFKDQFNLERAKRKAVDTRRSQTPLHDFTSAHVEEGACEMAVGLRELLAMQDSSLGTKYAADEAEPADLYPGMAVHDPKYFCRVNKEENPLGSTNVVFLNQKAMATGSQKLQNYSPLYWTTRLKVVDKWGVNHETPTWHSLSSNQFLLSILPENFGWILRYFAALFSLQPSEIYFDLLKCEAVLEKTHPQYFGQMVRNNQDQSQQIETTGENYLSLEKTY